MNESTPMLNVPEVPLCETLQSFAQDFLGPISQELLAQPDVLGAIGKSVQMGVLPEDAALKEIHARITDNSGLADEFFAHFFEHLLRLRVVDLYPGLKRFLDTDDLVQSVLGDIWKELGTLEFKNRASFLSLLGQRVKWKANDKKRSLNSQKRREDLRVEASAETIGASSKDSSALSHQLSREEHEELLLAVFRLPQQDRTLVKLYLRGASAKELASASGLSVTASRKALERALARARSLVLSRYGS